MTRHSKPYITFFVLLVVLVAIILFINLKLVTVVKTRYYIKASDPSNELEEKPENQTSRKELMKLAEPSELWLSFDDQVENAKLIADAGEKKKPRKENQNPGPISEEIELRSGKKYFIEVLHIGQRKGSYLSVKLKSPGNEAFLNIEKEVLLPFFQNDFDLKNAFYDIEIPSVASCVNSTKENPFLLEKHTSYSSHEIFAGILPNCDLPNPSESRKLERKTIKLQRHHSIHRKYYTSIFVYPYDMVNRVGSNSDYKTRPLPAWNHDNMLNKTSATNIVELLLNRTRKRLRK
ncbi:hypothetical protein AC249_AIPGENE24433 [Exaiptasia diaphana]|nr:hypothetical protein AC249_AIPGENE24433 [Exaiptasia diaphana]